MSQGNQFYQYGYDHYLKAPQKKPQHRVESAGFFAMVKSKMRSPVVATIALLVAGGVFASVIISAYPSQDDDQVLVPIVKADLRPIRMEPKEPGGMEIPHRDSTVLAQIGQERMTPMQSSDEKIENLFASMPQQREVMTKAQALNQEAQMQSLSATPAPQVYAADSSMDEGMMRLSEMDDPYASNPFQTAQLVESEEELAIKITDLRAPSMLPKGDEASGSVLSEQPAASNLLQKIGGTHEAESGDVAENSAFVAEVAQAAVSTKPAAPKVLASAPSRQMHAPATSPETLDFVRSVLNDDVSSATPIKPEAVEPAAGAAAPVQGVATSAPYFVQLASITDPARAGTEFKKMQSQYNALVRASYRVQEASLSSGKFYRIQAGPMSKADADRVCASLKAQGKPGGCLVVK